LQKVVASGSFTPLILSRPDSEVLDEEVSGKTNSVDLSEISAPRVPKKADSAMSPPSKSPVQHTASLRP
jgi:hypothetical protein